jgi:leader peptidase (prepilin peptidase)/N-methyltransferase
MEIVVTVSFCLLGAVLASFVCVIAERIYTGQSWLQGRSRCNSCRKQLRVFDLVPVFSLLLSRGKCRGCHARIPLLYSFFEAALGAAFGLSYLTLGLTIQLGVFLCALLVLFFIVVYDLRHTLVPWGASGLLILLGGLFAMLETLSGPNLQASEPQMLGATVLAAAAIALFFFLLYALSRGKWMGLGDTPVAFALSLLVGSAAIPGLLFSFWIGAVIGIVVLVMRRGGPTMGIEIPFVPFLALGYLLAFFTQWNPLSLVLW